jgi:aldehyde dehydrogenase (NAD+)
MTFEEDSKLIAHRADSFFIDGVWAAPLSEQNAAVINPASEQPIAQVALGGKADIDRAVQAARRAFVDFSRASRGERIDLLRRIADLFRLRLDFLAGLMTDEMGAPLDFSRNGQALSALTHIETMIAVLTSFSFETEVGASIVRREPIGVCGLITPWNWPLHQIVCKVVPALAAGCTMVLKPSETAPLNALAFAEILAEAGVPNGVFNLVNGDGPTAGRALSTHPDVDLVSFTGSTRAGIQVAKDAADTVKRVLQELGGQAANIVLDDADLTAAVEGGIAGCFLNTGQSCDAPARMLVPAELMAAAVERAKQAAEGYRVGPPRDPLTTLGPVSGQAQYDRIQAYIGRGISEGARLVSGGLGRPTGLERGYYVRPTVFAGVAPDMTIAQEEVFGPVLSLIAYRGEEEAVRIANGTLYGLAAYVQSADLARARRIAGQLRAGTVQINYPVADPLAPFGGYKRSGNGREYGEFGLAEFLELKTITG